MEPLRGRQHGAPAHRSQAAPTRADRLAAPHRAPPRPGRGDRHRRRQRRARRDRGRQRPLERPAGPVDARRADLRPADRRLRPDRQGRAGPLPARGAPASSPSTRSPSSSSTRRRRPRTARSGRTRLRPGGDPRPRSPRTRAAAATAAPRRSPSSSSGRGSCRRTRSRPAPTATCARPRSSSSRSRLTDALPRRGRQAADHHRLPERDLLRPRRLRDRRRGARSTSASPTSPKLTPAQAALLAGLPKSPSTLDPYRYAEADDKGRLVVPPDAPPVVRRNYILQQPRRRRPLDDAVAGGARRRRSTSRSSSPATGRWRSRRRSSRGRSAASSTRSSAPDAPVETGGYTRDHDARLERPAAAEQWLAAAVDRPEPQVEAGDAPAAEPEDRPSRTAAGSTTCAARTSTTRRSSRSTTGPATCWPTSAAPATTGTSLASRKFEPKYDAAGDGARQPGSAWKPIVYASAFDTGKPHAGQPPPRHHDRVRPRPELGAARRRPARARPGPRPQGAPVLAQHPGDPGAPAGRQRGGRRPGRERSGIRFTGGTEAFLQAGLAGAIGTVEVRPLDLTSAYGDDRQRRRPRPAADDPRGPRRDRQGRSTRRPTPKPRPGGQPAGRVPRHRHPRRATPTPSRTRSGRRPSRSATGPHGEHRPVAVKTGHRERRPRPRDVRLPRARPRTRRSRRSRSGSGWATATTRTRGRRSRRSR